MRTSCTFPDTITDPTISHLLAIGAGALKALQDHLSKPSPPPPLSEGASSVPPWWSLISIPFHFILILLSLDTPESLNQVSRAFSTLQAVAVVFDSQLTREATQNATMLIRLSQNRKERDVKTLRDALSGVHGTNENGLTGSEPLGRYVVLEPERVVNDGLNGNKAGQQQPMGDGLAGARNFVPDLNGFVTGDTDGLINPDNLAMDWDALLGNPDLLDWI